MFLMHDYSPDYLQKIKEKRAKKPLSKIPWWKLVNEDLYTPGVHWENTAEWMAYRIVGEKAPRNYTLPEDLDPTWEEIIKKAWELAEILDEYGWEAEWAKKQAEKLKREMRGGSGL